MLREMQDIQSVRRRDVISGDEDNECTSGNDKTTKKDWTPGVANGVDWGN
jgi:hypothetical protein